MKARLVAGVALVCFSAHAIAAVDESDDRLTLMASHLSLSDIDGGNGFSVGWLHNFDATKILGLAVEHQTLADVHWAFGTLDLSVGVGQADRRSTMYLDARAGSGSDPGKSFKYQIVSVGLIQSLTHRFALQIEDKQIDVDTTHGNLPKVGAQFLWTPALLTSLSYSHSLGDNLGTRLWSARVDRYGKQFSFILGGAAGQASPVVFEKLTGVRTPGQTLKEGFVGITKPLPRVDVTLLGDYLRLNEEDRITVTLNAIVHLRAPVRR
jgi:hypothetical protein